MQLRLAQGFHELHVRRIADPGVTACSQRGHEERAGAGHQLAQAGGIVRQGIATLVHGEHGNDRYGVEAHGPYRCELQQSSFNS